MLVSLSMWIIARFSPLEWYLLKHPNLEESLCHEHDSKVYSLAQSDRAAPGEAVDEQHCCHHSSPPSPTNRRLLSPRKLTRNNEDEVKVDDNDDNFQESDESDFNKHQPLQRRVVVLEGEIGKGQHGDRKSRNEFQTYNEGDNHSQPSLPQKADSGEGSRGRGERKRRRNSRKPAQSVNKGEGPRDNPLDLLEDMPFDVNGGDVDEEDVAVMDEYDDDGQQQSNLRHTHNDTELLCSANDFTLSNSFWFTIGTLMQQGSDLNPKVKRGEISSSIC